MVGLDDCNWCQPVYDDELQNGRSSYFHDCRNGSWIRSLESSGYQEGPYDCECTEVPRKNKVVNANVPSTPRNTLEGISLLVYWG